MRALPFDVRYELEGWILFWADLQRRSEGQDRLRLLRQETARQVRNDLQVENLSAHPTVAALRRLFRAAGCDPTRYRPSSEALLRRILKGAEMPAISPLVDLNNCLSAKLAVPCCVMARETVVPPFLFRAGQPGESYESLRGPFNLAGKPLLTDALGPCDAPITGSNRVKVDPETERAWLVAYLPAGVVEPELANQRLEQLVASAPVAQVLLTTAV